MHQRPFDRADQASANGNASALAVFAKLGREMAASLSPQDWGDKVQIDSRQLIVHTNLDFSVCESLEGIIQAIPDEVAGDCGPRPSTEAPKLPAPRED